MFYRILKMLIGFTLVAFGSYCMIKTNVLGVAPFTALYILLSNHWLTIGTWVVIIQFLFMVLSLLIERKLPKIGTFINMVYTGIMIDFFNYIDVLPEANNYVMLITVFILGIAVSGFGVSLAIKANLGPGAITQFSNALYGVYNVNIRNSIIALDISVAVIVLILGGPVSFGTIICGFLTGIFTDIGLKVINKFETR